MAVVAFAGGGTGGHIFPALALAETIQKHAPEVVLRFIGNTGGPADRFVPQAGLALDTVASGPVTGGGIARAVRGLFSVLRGTLRALVLLRRHRVDLVIGVGGYASAPTILAAALLRIPIGVVEADARPGATNIALARFARAVFVQYREATAFFPAGRAHQSGYPVRVRPTGAPVHEPCAPLHVTVIGGSQGARSINEAMMAIAPSLAAAGLRITHQTGPADFERVRAAYAAAGIEVDAAAFFDDLPRRLAATDFVVARSGSTVAELAIAGLPAILVPNPRLAHDHQTANARAVERDGAAVVLDDDTLSSELEPAVLALARDDARRAEMAEAARQRARPNAALDIWKACSAWL